MTPIAISSFTRQNVAFRSIDEILNFFENIISFSVFLQNCNHIFYKNSRIYAQLPVGGGGLRGQSPLNFWEIGTFLMP